jgi:hypothetical protein
MLIYFINLRDGIKTCIYFLSVLMHLDGKKITKKFKMETK